jgi:hypothetical protein
MLAMTRSGRFGVRCTVLLAAFVAVVVDGVAFSGVFDTSTFSASEPSKNQLGSALQSYFNWGDEPIFSLFQGSAGPSPSTTSVLFGFGSSDPAANQLQVTYSEDVSNYLSDNPNATLLRASLQGNGIILYSIVSVASTQQPATGGDVTKSPLEEYLPAIIVGGVALVLVVVGAVVFVVVKRRSAVDDRLFDTMEAMMDEDNSSATRGVEGIQPNNKSIGGSKLPPPTSSGTARNPAPPPQQSV